MHRYESRTHYQFLSSGSKQYVSVNIRNSLTQNWSERAVEARVGKYEKNIFISH